MKKMKATFEAYESSVSHLTKGCLDSHAVWRTFEAFKDMYCKHLGDTKCVLTTRSNQRWMLHNQYVQWTDPSADCPAAVVEKGAAADATDALQP
jgi:hypothetical protein